MGCSLTLWHKFIRCLFECVRVTVIESATLRLFAVAFNWLIRLIACDNYIPIEFNEHVLRERVRLIFFFSRKVYVNHFIETCNQSIYERKSVKWKLFFYGRHITSALSIYPSIQSIYLECAAAVQKTLAKITFKTLFNKVFDWCVCSLAFSRRLFGVYFWLHIAWGGGETWLQMSKSCRAKIEKMQKWK